MKKINILIVDDHKIVRDGIKLYLNNHSEFNIVGEGSDGTEATEFLKQNQNVDLVLIDINMEKMNGIEATKIIATEFSDVKVLALTMHNDYQHIKSMMDAGAGGYILKSCNEEEMLDAINAVMEDELYYSNEVAQTVMNNMAKRKPKAVGLTPLTPREKEIYRMILDEQSNTDIADKLFISVRTVEVHKRNLMEKTGSKNSTGLVLYAIKNQLFDDLV